MFEREARGAGRWESGAGEGINQDRCADIKATRARPQPVLTRTTRVHELKHVATYPRPKRHPHPGLLPQGEGVSHEGSFGAVPSTTP